MERIAEVVTESERLTLRQTVSLGDLTLGPRTRLLFAGVAIPEALTPLRPIAVAEDGRVTVQWRDPEGFTVSEPLTVVAPCDSFAADWGSYDPEPSSPQLFRAAIPADRPIALAIEPGGPTVAMTDPNVIMPNLSVVEERDGWVRIEWAPVRHLVVAWVRAADLVKPRPHGPECCGGAHVPTEHEETRPTTWMCEHDVPIVLERGQDRWVVGHVHTGALIVAEPAGDPFVELDVVHPSNWRSVVPDARAGERYVVRSIDMQGCSVAPPSS